MHQDVREISCATQLHTWLRSQCSGDPREIPQSRCFHGWECLKRLVPQFPRSYGAKQTTCQVVWSPLTWQPIPANEFPSTQHPENSKGQPHAGLYYTAISLLTQEPSIKPYHTVCIMGNQSQPQK